MKRRPWIVVSVMVMSLCLGTSAAPPPQAPGLVRAVKVLPDKAPDCTSLKAIADSVTRGCKTNDEKAIAVYNFMNLAHYHRQYPTQPGGLPVLKEINCYGWSLCGGLHAEQSAIWRELGWDWRFVGWQGHTTVEAQYDGRWHYLDVFLKFYAWMPDGQGGRTIAGEDDLTADPQTLIQAAYEMDKARNVVYAKADPFVMNGQKANWQGRPFLCCGDTIQGTVDGLKTHHRAGRSEGWGGIIHATGDYSADVDLAPGMCLENTWDPQPDAWYWRGAKEAPRHTCGGHKDTRNDPSYGLVLEPYVDSKPARSYANGTLTFAPDFASSDLARSFVSLDNARQEGKALVVAAAGQPGRTVFALSSPYILVKAGAQAAGADGAEVSVDGGKTYKAVDLADFSAAVKGEVSVLIRVSFAKALTSLKVEAVIQNNSGSLPYLSPGRNQVAVTLADPKALGKNTLVVTYAFRTGSRSKSFEQLCEEGKEIAKQHNAKWSDTLSYVRKSFRAEDLPATFSIDCPTPKGQYPVYPRMVFLRREVVAPGGTPRPLGDGAVEAAPAPADQLKELPNPFLIGSAAPPKVKQRDVRTIEIPLSYVGFVSETGETVAKGSLRWPKNAQEHGKVVCGAVLLAADLKDVPAKGLAGARLMVPVREGHNKAPAKLGVVALSERPEPGKGCDVKALTEIAGTGIVPQQPADTPEYKPAKPIALDVTRLVRAVAAGEAKCRGFALRIVPDRRVDDGWTVRCDVAPDEPVRLEVDVYAE
ncbi:MAG: hypothetical protein BWX88_00164 [Planctomycetes bacterium ADurb.Bin126]|nr:MAG: hypothetical protein BWX88_00164 [Planctomycetes bacterium ADurb.Bin126]HQL73038.1 hypothetical protein [Phycisphaerae bacterium]